jgi:crotonobetainyl-CoA:carnitine CoA-transferase CaiB-like acyl-CoA transferase
MLEADRHWPKLIAALGRPDLAVDERFVDAKARKANSEALVVTLDEAFGAVPYEEMTAAFDREDVWWAPINSIVDAIADPQVRASGAFVEMTPQPGEGAYVAVNGPVDFDDRRPRPGPVPRLGQHTADVTGAS